jgi:RHS repeat-associated protein
MEPMSAWRIEQDAADQLTGVSVEGRAAGRQVFSYDLAGNRLTVQSGNATSTTAYNALNQITGISGGGRLRFSGTTSEAANVSVQGRAARMLDATTFTADAEVVPGVNTIPVVAADGNGNRRTNNYQVTVPGGATRAFVYDGNGNLLDDGERTYQWDAKNRLIEAKRGADTWQWSYNAFDQRVSEKKNGVVTKRWVWAGGNQPAEERDAAGNVTRRFYPQGEQAGAVKSFYTKDHLGSIREVLGANGTVVSSSRYDAWGMRTTQGAQDAASFGFTGHLEHKELGLVFTLYRAYDPVTGRWLSRDPIGENGGINLYGYVLNNPVNWVDPIGLETAVVIGGPAGKNVFGHIAIATSGSGIYSSGTKQSFGSSFTDYINDQVSYRNNTVYIINTTPEEEAKIIEAFKERNKSGHDAKSNNCSHQVSDALKQAGIIDRVTAFPGTLHSPMREGIKRGDVTAHEVPKGATSLPKDFDVFNPK